MRSLQLDDGATIPGGRLVVFHPPKRDRFYSAGIDFAYGIETGDCDACTILDEYGDQCAVLHGRWGPDEFRPLLCDLLDWYRDVFVVGERQVGLVVLRHLYDDGRWLYYQADEEHRARPMRDKLGHPKSANDYLIARLRKALTLQPDPDDPAAPPSPAIRVYDAATLDELKAYQFLPKRGVTLEGLRDTEVKMGAPPGSHDDLVISLAYAWMGLLEMPKFPKPVRKPVPGTMEALLDHAAVLTPPPPPPSKVVAGPTFKATPRRR